MKEQKMTKINVDTPQCPAYSKGKTVVELYNFLGELISAGKSEAPVFVTDGVPYGDTLAVGVMEFQPAQEAEAATLTPTNRFEAVVVDYLESLSGGYVTLTSSNPALSLERLEHVEYEMAERLSASRMRKLTRNRGRSVGDGVGGGGGGERRSAAGQKISDPYDFDWTVGDLHRMITGGMKSGVLNSASPFRIYSGGNYVQFSVLSLTHAEKSPLAEPLDERESAALETYSRKNLNRLEIVGEPVRSDERAMNRAISSMQMRAEAIPELAMNLPLAV